MDFRGALDALATELEEIGGYWLCRRVRMVSGALGGSIVPDAPEVVDDTLLCRVVTL